MFGIGMPELLLIMAVALIVIGPKKLPDLARSLGKALGEFKKATRELKETIDIDQDMGDLKKAFHDIDRDIIETAHVSTDDRNTDSKADPAPEEMTPDTETDHRNTKGPDHD